MRIGFPVVPAFLIVTACGGGNGGGGTQPPPGPTPGVPTAISVTAGDAQSAPSATAVAVRPSVTVRDGLNDPVSGATVTFSVAAGGGSVTGASATTDTAGVATVGAWTLGNALGANQLRAQVGNLSVTFSATSILGPPALIDATAGDNQSVTVGQPVPGDIDLTVTDLGGNPIAGAVVDLLVGSSGATISTPQVTADGTGVARVTGGSWTLSTVAGQQVLQAQSGAAVKRVNATATPDVPTTILSQTGSQAATLADPVFEDPAVLVEDQYANPVPGVDVTFTPQAGSGSVATAVVTTGANGRASTSWTLGPSGLNTLDASYSGGSTVSFTGYGANSNFSIELIYTVTPPPSQRDIFAQAAARWMETITGDITDEILSTPAGFCFSGQPPLVNRQVDDLMIFVQLQPIDGPGSILGQAGPCAGRSASGADPYLSTYGVMTFDTDDTDVFEAQGLLDEIILHEMGHVLGIGTLWGSTGFLQNPSCCSNQGADTHFDGPLAIAAFDAAGGTLWMPPTSADSKVPVENTQGGPGTLDGHWRESTMDNELMTGFIDAGFNPISLITIASLEDIGYTVDNAQADPYTIANLNGLRTALKSDGSGGAWLHNDIFVPLWARR